jgi:hypothetical protein
MKNLEKLYRDEALRPLRTVRSEAPKTMAWKNLRQQISEPKFAVQDCGVTTEKV